MMRHDALWRVKNQNLYMRSTKSSIKTGQAPAKKIMH